MGDGPYILKGTLTDFIETFKDEASCVDYLMQTRWPDGETVCARCDNDRFWKTARHQLKCSRCKAKFSVRHGTIFYQSRLPLQKWFVGLWLMVNNKKGANSCHLARELGITQKSAWFMVHRVNQIAQDMAIKVRLNGIVEIDDMFVGGKESNKPVAKRVRTRKNKTPVVGLTERAGALRLAKVPTIAQSALRPVFDSVLRDPEAIFTDAHHAYRELDRRIINHTNKEFVNGVVHVNTIEGVFSHFKRTINGIHHSISSKHMQRYLDMFSVRWNSRDTDNVQRFNMFLSNSATGKISYSTLIKN